MKSERYGSNCILFLLKLIITYAITAGIVKALYYYLSQSTICAIVFAGIAIKNVVSDYYPFLDPGPHFFIVAGLILIVLIVINIGLDAYEEK